MRRTHMMVAMVATTVALALPVFSASAQVGRHPVRREAGDVRDARRELHDDVRDRREAVREGDRREVRQESREIRYDKRNLAQEKRELHRTVVRHRRG